MKFTYLMQPPRRYTFEMPKLYTWLINQCEGKTLNLFAGKVKLIGINETRIDTDPTVNPDYNMDAFDFVKMWSTEHCNCCPDKFDTVILDPPYNLRKSREKYGGRYIGSFTKIKNLIPQIVSDNGKVISFGYSSVGMSKSRGFTKEEICLICHSGDYQDTIITVERKI